MKIDSVMTMEVKTRGEELEELLEPGGQLNTDIYAAILKIWQAQPTTEEPDDKLLKELDNALNRYLKYAIEYDRLTRN
jgi:hypothetical protein